jgi:hypothetical protein
MATGKPNDPGTVVELEKIEQIDDDLFQSNKPTVFIEGREHLEKALVRKIDYRLMPLMMLICTMSSYFSVPLQTANTVL